MGRIQLTVHSRASVVADAPPALEALLATREAFAGSVRWTIDDDGPAAIDAQRLALLRRLAQSGATLHCDCSDQRFQTLAAVGADVGWSADPNHKALRLNSHDPGMPLLVSVLIAAWNPRYFVAALHSALRQSYANIELIVADDSPTRQIEAMIAQVDAGPRTLRYVRNPVRLGVRKNYETLLGMAQGHLIKYLNDDDVLEPHCIERLVAGLERHPRATLMTSARGRIDGRGARLDDQPATQPFASTDTVIDGISLANNMLLAGLNIVGEPSTVLFRKRDIGGFDESPFTFRGATGRGVSDMVLWTRLLCRGQAVYLSERLSSFRIHPEQRQQRAEVIAMTTSGIRELQAAWIDFGLHELSAPQVLLARSPDADETEPFTPIALEGFLAPKGVSATQLQVAWRARQHPFFDQRAARDQAEASPR